MKPREIIKRLEKIYPTKAIGLSIEYDNFMPNTPPQKRYGLYIEGVFTCSRVDKSKLIISLKKYLKLKR